MPGIDLFICAVAGAVMTSAAAAITGIDLMLVMTLSPQN
jgi:hypothetical protein